MRKPILVCSKCGQEECFRGDWTCKDYETAGVVVKWIDIGTDIKKTYNSTRAKDAPIGIPQRRGKLWQG